MLLLLIILVIVLIFAGAGFPNMRSPIGVLLFIVIAFIVLRLLGVV